MYSFFPAAAIPADHTGFWLVVIACAFVTFLVLVNDAELFFRWFFVATIICTIAYFVSYSWTDQTAKTFPNTKVTAEFVGYETEGYRERSGKTHVDRHLVYVIYSVNGNNVLLPANVGTEYPKFVTLYKN
jgi:hypothetical protein